jgi:hypothetical protein
MSAYAQTHTHQMGMKLAQTYRREFSTITAWYNRIDNTKTMKIPYNCLESLCIYIIGKQHTCIFHHCSWKKFKDMNMTKTPWNQIHTYHQLA